MRKIIFIICMLFAINSYAVDFSKDTKKQVQKKKKIYIAKKKDLEAKLLKIKKDLQDAIAIQNKNIADADTAIANKP